jgi:predicted AAA+ superfamily ATPase
MGARQIGKTTILSLAVYKGKYNPKLRVCISSLNLDQTGDLINIPLFYVEKVDQFIEKAINL